MLEITFRNSAPQVCFRNPPSISPSGQPGNQARLSQAENRHAEQKDCVILKSWASLIIRNPGVILNLQKRPGDSRRRGSRRQLQPSPVVPEAWTDDRFSIREVEGDTDLHLGRTLKHDGQV